jgi:hypothetical protein
MEDERKIEYISLAQAAKLCKYSQEYLSLRARQGKLRSIKLGRNWVTTHAWLQEYIKTVEAYNGRNGRGEKEESFVDSVQEKLVAKKETFGEPPENLPIGEPLLQPISNESLHPLFLRIVFSSSLLLFAVFVGTIVLIPLFAKESGWSTSEFLQQYFVWLGESAEKIVAFPQERDLGIAQVNLEAITVPFGKIVNTIKEDFSFAFQFLRERVLSLAGKKEAPRGKEEMSPSTLAGKTNELEQNIIGDIQKRFGEFRSNMGLAQKEGLIAIPSTGRDEETKEKIMRSFSDEVVIEQKDETSGIIRPIFRTMAEQAYLYLMVPMKN